MSMVCAWGRGSRDLCYLEKTNMSGAVLLCGGKSWLPGLLNPYPVKCWLQWGSSATHLCFRPLLTYCVQRNQISLQSTWLPPRLSIAFTRAVVLACLLLIPKSFSDYGCLCLVDFLSFSLSLSLFLSSLLLHSLSLIPPWLYLSIGMSGRSPFFDRYMYGFCNNTLTVYLTNWGKKHSGGLL